MGVKVVARLRIVYGSRKFLAELAQRYKFLQWIQLSLKKTTGAKLEAVLEDVFEAFIGALEYLVDTHIRPGLGYIACNNFIVHTLEESVIDFAYENLFDAKTRLKEVVDCFNQQLSRLKYTVVSNSVSITVCVMNTTTHCIGTQSIINRQSDAEQVASEAAIKVLAGMGYSKPVPEEYRRIAHQLVSRSNNV
jgi:dsRNA-specific ribonuclease